MAYFDSGDIAMPIVSGRILRRENRFGIEVSSRGGTGGATLAAIPFLVPPGFLSRGPLNDMYLYLLFRIKCLGGSN